MIDDQVTRHVARLARLQLSDAEMARMQHELSAILDYVDQVRELALEEVSPTTHAIPLENVMRDDLPAPSVPAELALREAPEVHGDGFAVPRMG